MNEWELIVGNIGTVYRGANGFTARTEFARYLGQSNAPHGRASGESVTLLFDGELVSEHYGRDTD